MGNGAETKEGVRRDFWRCGRCLTIMATENLTDHWEPLRCACGSKCRWMGTVERGHLVRTEQLCACDARCTEARGPKCQCQCGGKNHGTGAVITVKHDEGGIPRATGLDVAANMEKAEAFEAAAEELRASIHAQYPEVAAKRRGEWISKWDSYLDGSAFLSDVRRAGNLKTHGGRMKRLEKVAKRFHSYQKGVAV